METGKRIVLMCGGKKCCPALEVHTDGSITIHDTDDGRNQHIKLSLDQLKMLKENT